MMRSNFTTEAQKHRGITEGREEVLNREEQDPLTGSIIGPAIEVHKVLGPGLLESVYEECLSMEFNDRNI